MESTVKHLTTAELEAALDHLRQTPKDEGVVHLMGPLSYVPTGKKVYEVPQENSITVPQRGRMGDSGASYIMERCPPVGAGLGR